MKSLESGIMWSEVDKGRLVTSEVLGGLPGPWISVMDRWIVATHDTLEEAHAMHRRLENQHNAGLEVTS